MKSDKNEIETSFKFTLMLTIILLLTILNSCNQQTLIMDKNIFKELIVEAYNNKNYLSLSDLLDPDFTQHGPFGDIEKKTWINGLKIMHEAFPDLQMEINDIIVEGDKLVWRWMISGTNTGPFNGRKPTLRKVIMNGINIERFEQGKIVESWTSSDHSPLNTALGLD